MVFFICLSVIRIAHERKTEKKTKKIVSVRFLSAFLKVSFLVLLITSEAQVSV